MDYKKMWFELKEGLKNKEFLEVMNKIEKKYIKYPKPGDTFINCKSIDFIVCHNNINGEEIIKKYSMIVGDTFSMPSNEKGKPFLQIDIISLPDDLVENPGKIVIHPNPWKSKKFNSNLGAINIDDNVFLKI